MLKLILLGCLAGLFFSSTFIFNELMSVGGGHWVWAASLRYLFMVLFLSMLIPITQGPKALSGLAQLFVHHWPFWIMSGGIGFGAFYGLICFSADYSPGWVIAATWQLTIVASLLVLMLFGRSFPPRVWLYSLLILIGVMLLNLSHVNGFELRSLLLGGLPVLIAAFCYPLGNQLIWEAKAGGHSYLPQIRSPLLENAFNKVWLMSLGSMPLWFLLIALYRPPSPSLGQVVQTAMVALLSGVVATTLFLYARSHAKQPSEIAAVDATQSSEVVFAIVGSSLLIEPALPGGLSLLGLVMIFVGLALFVKQQHVQA